MKPIWLVLFFALNSGSARAGQCRDRDRDGFGRSCARGDDCNDRRPDVHPGADERCDLIDNDCDGLVDESDACPAVAHDRTPVSVPAGPFIMGSDDGAPDERPMHEVTLADFVIDRYEVTNARYRTCVRAGECAPPALASSRHRAAYFEDDDYADYPVIFVSWQQAAAYCRFAGGRLPTEAEWEKAARGAAPSTSRYPWGDEPPDCSRANMDGCVGDTDVIGRRELGASPFGALDMAGNVWEWVADWYDPSYYRHAPAEDPTGPERGTLKVMRGGCWESGATLLRVSCRRAELPRAWADNIGFRCAYDRGGDR